MPIDDWGGWGGPTAGAGVNSYGSSRASSGSSYGGAGASAGASGGVSSSKSGASGSVSSGGGSSSKSSSSSSGVSGSASGSFGGGASASGGVSSSNTGNGMRDNAGGWGGGWSNGWGGDSRQGGSSGSSASGGAGDNSNRAGGGGVSGSADSRVGGMSSGNQSGALNYGGFSSVRGSGVSAGGSASAGARAPAPAAPDGMFGPRAGPGTNYMRAVAAGGPLGPVGPVAGLASSYQSAPGVKDQSRVGFDPADLSAYRASYGPEMMGAMGSPLERRMVSEAYANEYNPLSSMRAPASPRVAGGMSFTPGLPAQQASFSPVGNLPMLRQAAPGARTFAAPMGMGFTPGLPGPGRDTVLAYNRDGTPLGRVTPGKDQARIPATDPSYFGDIAPPRERILSVENVPEAPRPVLSAGNAYGPFIDRFSLNPPGETPYSRATAAVGQWAAGRQPAPTDIAGVRGIITGAVGGALAAPRMTDRLGNTDVAFDDDGTYVGEGPQVGEPYSGLGDPAGPSAPPAQEGTGGVTAGTETVNPRDYGGSGDGGFYTGAEADGGPNSPGTPQPDPNGEDPDVPVRPTEGIMPWHVPYFLQIADRLNRAGIAYTAADFITDFYGTRYFAPPSYQPPQAEAA